ncbi:MAG: homoserine dehydrogenase [Methanophagales archaeon]|nr:homoserine dehydrogenase [Methanophagales archaeon]
MKEKTVRISIAGFGHVGGGVAEIVRQKREEIARIHGINIKIVGIADLRGVIVDENGLSEDAILKLKREKRKRKGEEAEDIYVDTNTTGMTTLEMIREVEHEIMVEATPTNIVDGEPGLSHIITALESGRHVVTSNKGPMALESTRLIELAAKKGKELRFGSTVGGATPIISLIRENLAGNRIISVKGILNGTCNYILTRMTEEGLPYEHVLKEAQELGIAEADPSKDVSGIDTALKLVILANFVFGLNASYKDVEVVGIEEITLDALKLADDAGYVIKLIGAVDQEGDLSVRQRLVPKENPLNVGGTLNVATIRTDLAGDITIVGKGAGPIETASAVISDIISIG